MAGREPLYRDFMTWRATKNALAGGVLLGARIQLPGHRRRHRMLRHSWWLVSIHVTSIQS